MRLLDRLIILSRETTSALDGLSDDLHLRTDPACKLYRSVKPGTWLDRASRGTSCSPCMIARAFGWNDPELNDSGATS